MFTARLLLRRQLHPRLHPRLHPQRPPSQPCRPRMRAFHATAPRKDPLDAWLWAPHEMLQCLHTALPWYAAIPVSAFIFRGLLVSTLGMRVRSLTARYVGLHPLRQAIAFQTRDKLMKQGGFKTPKHAMLAVRRATYLQTADLDRRWECTVRGQIGWTLLQLPIFITMAELIRQMSNSRDGLLAMCLNAVGFGREVNSEQHALPANPWFEPSLANEGMLWFPDLIVPDPTGMLPFVVSALMFTNVYTSKNSPDNMEKMSRTTTIIRRTLLAVSLMIGPLGQEMPAALMLYWASSTASVMLWNVWLDRRYPTVKGFGKCERPLLLMPPRTPPKARRR